MGIPIPVNYEELLKDAQDLIRKKDNIELQLQQYEQILNSAGVNMQDPLVDNAGFPRNDIDVATIRATRNQVHILRNDARKVLEQIDETLVLLHQAKKSTKIEKDIKPVTDIPAVQLVPFAIVNAVAPDSPAYLAGLRRNQKILKFGPVEAPQGLQDLNAYVSQSENMEISLEILEQNDHKVLKMTPRNGWGGRGSLGCHLLPL